MSLTKDQWLQVKCELDSGGAYGRCVLMINDVRITLTALRYLTSNAQ